MMVSVVIVSYNVKYFLEQCLCSVERAITFSSLAKTNSQFLIPNSRWPIEVFVADNHSTDGTVEYLQPRFPFVHFIFNAKNAGFAVANNQVLPQAAGKYTLFLNPDTILPEDFFSACIGFMESHSDAGALGVRMVDGSGNFLKESKRGIPTPWVAFCKMAGLTRLFPASKIFARYYLGHLPETKTQVVEALPGACMMVRKEVLDSTGGFDERFFMYAEDIDLSWRIQQAGYKNYYFPNCTIIHFKGESTRKNARYVKLFYKAMAQFAEKHFRGKMPGVSFALLKAAIAIRATLTLPRKKMPGHKVLKNSLYVDYTGICKFGDEESMQELPFSHSSRRQPVNASTLVFCEGADCSFKEIIAGIQQHKNKQLYIHGKGTGSSVGSHAKDRQGHSFSW